jgi:hypothetical protein
VGFLMANKRKVLKKIKRVSAAEAAAGGMFSHEALTGQADVSVESKRKKVRVPIRGGVKSYTERVVTETPRMPSESMIIPPAPVIRESASMIAPPAPVIRESEPMTDIGQLAEEFPPSGKIEARVHWTSGDVDDYVQGLRARGAKPGRIADFIEQLPPKDIERQKGLLGETSDVMKELARREGRAAPAPSAPVAPAGVSAEVPPVSPVPSVTTVGATPSGGIREWWRDYTTEVISDDDKKAYVGGYRGPAKVSLDHEFAQANSEYTQAREQLADIQRRQRELPKERLKRNREKADLQEFLKTEKDPAKRREAEDRLLKTNERLLEISGELEDANSQARSTDFAVTSAKLKRDKASQDLGSWQAAYTKGDLEWRQKYTESARTLKSLYERGQQYEKMGGTIGGPGIADNLSKMIQAPMGSAGKIGDRWSSIMGKAPGYREDRSVTDVVGYGGRKEDWTRMFPAVTGLGSSVRTLVKPTIGVAGSSSARMQFDLTTPAKRITLGDISAAGIPTVRNIPHPQEITAVPTPYADRTQQTVAGTPAWQRARRKKIVRKKGIMYGGGMVNGSLHLETGHINISAGKAAFGIGHFGIPSFNPMTRFRTPTPTVETPKMTVGKKKKVTTVSTPASKVESPKLSAIDIGKSSIGIAPGRMQEFTVAQCHANVVSADIMKGISNATIKRKRKKRGG